MPSFTKNYTSGNIKSWQKWLAGFIDKPNVKALEIGAYEGRSTLWFVDNILNGRNSDITIIESFTGEPRLNISVPKSVKTNLLENIKGNEKVKLIEKESFYGLCKLQGGKHKYDFIYIDGSHMSQNVLEDSVLAWRLLKQGGILIWDDYRWGKSLSVTMRPRIAIDAFLSIYQGKYDLMEIGWQVCIAKHES